MYHPTTRVLTVLDLLQSRGSVRGAELAARLEVDVRTVRRYVTMLQEMGIPVEARPGRYGGYRLRPGFRMPPLMLADDEALAVTLGLIFARRYGLAGAAPATGGALAKIERVLPDALRLQVRALAAALVLDVPQRTLPDAPRAPVPSPAILLALAAAIAGERRVTLAYRDRKGVETVRSFDPYGVAYLTNGAWYTVGWCHLRGDVRVFRLDRVTRVEPEGSPFARVEAFDCLAHVQRSLALLPVRWSVEVVLDAPLTEAQRWVAPHFAVVSDDEGEVVLRCTATDIDWLARTLVSLPLEFRVRTPPELRDALERLHARVGRLIAASPPCEDAVPASSAVG